jgi:hypothetical protein
MIIGDVLIWDDFPYPKHGPPKPRWFILLGDSCDFNGNTGYIYLLSPSKLVDQHILRYSKKADYKYMIFNKNEYGFKKRCLIDNKTGFYDDFLNSELINNQDVKITGNIDNNGLKNIYNEILKEHEDISPIVLSNIKSCFTNYCGIKDL